MAVAPYKLSCVLSGHSLDVRSVAVTHDGWIVSGSRDKCAKIWKPNGLNTGYCETETLFGHSRYVVCVCVLPPNDEQPMGLILTGSNDHCICAFTPDSFIPLFVLEGHTDTVCSLAAGLNENTALSASWDETACVWELDGSTDPLITLSGHQSAVWSVIQLTSGNIITGSADKTIKVWNEDGLIQHTLIGHTDCVRGLAATSCNKFLSCALDATVRYWNATVGTCLSAFYGHSHYIYSISVLPGAGVDTFVTSGEDCTIRIWEKGECQQTITLPAQSVWSVAYLQNGDIVAGSSDGNVRVFSADPRRQADPSLQQEFAEEVANISAAAQQDLGGVRISDLPGMVALDPGRSDGQTKIVRDGTHIYCYSWSAANREWVKAGNVVGASGGTQAAPGKQLHNGKEYDYVFGVVVYEGQPVLKLPYNCFENPWFVAQKFLHDNDLTEEYFGLLANLIKNNIKRSVPLGRGRTSVEFWEPFTDVCTNSTSISSSALDDCPVKQFFPHRTYVRFDQANIGDVMEMLLEFNRKLADGVHKIEEGHIQNVVRLAEAGATANPLDIRVLKQLLEWPVDILSPVLDVTHLAVRNAAINSDLCSGDMGDQLIDHLRRHISDSVIANHMLSIRILCNMLSHPAGEALALRHKDFLLSVLVDLVLPMNKQMQVALSTLFLNLAVAFNRSQDAPSRAQAVGYTYLILPNLCDPEAVFRALVAIGTLIWDADTLQDKEDMIHSVCMSSKVSTMIDNLSYGPPTHKVTQCAAQLIELLRLN